MGDQTLNMRVFITWSGDYSRSIAEVLRDWLPSVLQTVKPFMSSEDIRKGQRWQPEITKHLEESTFGLVCITQENHKCHPWIHFEAGAIARSTVEGRVAVVVTDLPVVDIPGPLKQFQATTLRNREDVWKLVQSINVATSEPLEELRLKRQFEKYWSDLENAIEEIPAPGRGGPMADDKETVKPSSVERMLEQMFELLKEQNRLLTQSASVSAAGFPPRVITPVQPKAIKVSTARICDLGGKNVQVEDLPDGNFTLRWIGGPTVPELMAEVSRLSLLRKS